MSKTTKVGKAHISNPIKHKVVKSEAPAPVPVPKKAEVVEPESDEDEIFEKNSVGQNIDKKITDENDVYLTPQNQRMIIQMEDEGMVFAGEQGKKANWYSKDILKTWVKQN